MISTQVKELLEITGKCNGNQYLHDDLTINWYEVRELLLKDYVEGVLESYEYCVKIKPTLDSIILNCLQIQDQPELFKKTILEFSQWTHSTSELCKIFIDWCDESEDYSILTTLQLTSMLEYALGSLYQSEKRVPPPHLLKDLLAELSDESSLEFEKVFLLRLVLGTSKGLNLRNIVWHGFIDSIHRCYPAFLFVIIVSYGKSLKCKKIAPKLRSEINFSISLQSKNIQVEDLLKSPTIMKCNFNLWKQIVSLQKRKKFKSSIFLLLSQIESVLRFIYGRINQVNVTARLNKYYVIMDSIFYDYVLDDDVTPLVIGKINKSQHTQIKETNRKNQMMETFPLSIIYLGYDLFHAVDGPRIRDRISHAEVFVKDENCELLLSTLFHFIFFVVSFYDQKKIDELQYQSIFMNNFKFVRKFNETCEVLELSFKSLKAPQEPSMKFQDFPLNTQQQIVSEVKNFFRPLNETQLVKLFLTILENLRVGLKKFNSACNDSFKSFDDKKLSSRKRKSLKQFIVSLPDFQKAFTNFLHEIEKDFVKIQSQEDFNENENLFDDSLKFYKFTLKFTENFTKLVNNDTRNFFLAHEKCCELIKLIEKRNE